MSINFMESALFMKDDGNRGPAERSGRNLFSC